MAQERITLLGRYIWVIDTILRYKRITFKELDAEWQRNVRLSEGQTLSKRSFDNWCKAIANLFQIDIECQRKGGYHYYIPNAEYLQGNNRSAWLYNFCAVNNTLFDTSELHPLILFDEFPGGIAYLRPLTEAMKHQRVVTLTYQSYWKNKAYTFDLQPYCLKAFHQRWYLVGLSTDPYFAEQGCRVYALDRIQHLEITNTPFARPKDWDSAAFFTSYFGVITDDTIPIEEIRIKVTASQANYLRSLPLHPSQAEAERTDTHSIFTYTLRPTYDFEQELLRHGAGIEVLAPASLRQRIAEQVRQMWATYHTPTDSPTR